jgi:hypothetical protein
MPDNTFTPAQPARRGSMAAQFTYDPEGEAYYFAPLGAQPGPYYTQRHVDAILDIAFDGTLAGVELIDRVPPPPCLASQPSPAATVETSQFETTKAGVIDWKMEAERANRLLAQAERPKCRLCGLEDGACICAHLPPRLSVGSDAANALAKRLHHAAVTMQNDDISEPQSEKRRRHIERYETLIDAVDYLSAQPQAAPVTPTGKVHTLKTWPRYFNEVLSGRKPFEWRINDRYYEVGDTLILQEWEPLRENLGCKEGHYTGRELRKVVSYTFSPFATNKATIVMAMTDEPSSQLTRPHLARGDE